MLIKYKSLKDNKTTQLGLNDMNKRWLLSNMHMYLLLLISNKNLNFSKFWMVT